MTAGTSTDIENNCGTCWKKTHEKLTSAFSFELAGTSLQPIGFISRGVVPDDFFTL
jgi:hypothetical protein